MRSVQKFGLHKELLDLLPSPIYVKDSEHRWVYVNPAFCALLDRPADFLLGKSDYDVTPKEQSDIFWEKDNQVLQTGETNINIEKTTNGLGEITWVESRKSYFENDAGERFIFGALTDVTQLKTREFELEEARKKAEAADVSKSQFLANMSHEIRTPMNGIMGMAEILAGTDLTTKQKSFADTIVKSGDALLTIINDILDFSKIDAGEMAIHAKPFNLADAVEDVAILISPLAAEKGLELAVRIDPDLPIALVGDAGRIRQIIANLLSNAVKFTVEGHVFIDIKSETFCDNGQPSVRLSICIEDTGVGIPLEKQATIFDKFTQVDNSAARTHEGTGLGLSICQSLLELMDGSISLESDAQSGSRFTIDLALPVHDDVVFCRPVATDLSGSHILIIDDNAVNREILLEQCTAWQFAPRAVASGAEGLALLKAADLMGTPFDAIVLDYQMPEMSGVDTAKLIRAEANVGDTPIVMLTSVDSSEISVSIEHLDIQGHLAKPARSSLLLETLSAAICQGKEKRPKISVQAPIPTTKTYSAPTISREDETTGPVDILVAEDNDVNIMVYEQILGQLGMSYRIAKNGAEAIEMYQALGPKLVIMDVSMPEVNGLDATAAIRDIEVNTGVKAHIIGATAHAMSGDMEKCLDAGMDDYLPKPISPKRLSEKLDRWMKPTLARASRG